MIQLLINSLPPTTNKAYVTVRGGRRALGPVGKKYKAETTNYIARKFPAELKYFKKNSPYLIVFQLCFGNKQDLINLGYPEKTENGYKELDISNRVKLVEDALSDATGLSDCHNWVVVVEKFLGEQDSTLITAIDLKHEPGNPLYGAIYALRSAVPG